VPQKPSSQVTKVTRW